jgi:pimeloyl-ACP methyl ester carboxylesterase
MGVEREDIVAYPAMANDIMTRVLESGGRDSEVAFFLHGVGARADRWVRNLAVIAEAGYRCIAVDLPGHGFADKGAKAQYGVAHYADFVEAFFEEHGIGNAHFIGTSLGAHVLGTLACRTPKLCKSLTLVGPTGLFPLGAEAADRIATRISDQSRGGIRTKLLSVIYDPRFVSERLVEEEYRINNSPGARISFERLADYFRERLDSDLIGDKLTQLAKRIPILAVWGECDRSVPLTIGQQVQSQLGIPLAVIPQTAHAPYWEAPEAFNKVICRFLSDLKAIPA